MGPNPSVSEILAIDGKILDLLDDREKLVLKYYQSRGRKYGVSVIIANEVDPEELAKARSRQQADDILETANSRIAVKISRLH
jgi:hypothetical protein